MFSALRYAPVLAVGLCSKKDATPDLVWVQFNGDGDQIEVSVTASDELGPTVAIPLTSNTGEVIVGGAKMKPSSGPVGAEHRITVTVFDDFAERVSRVEILADAGDRGIQTLEMKQDSADPGVWVYTAVALGLPGEVRKDLFTFTLWVAEEAPPEVK